MQTHAKVVDVCKEIYCVRMPRDISDISYRNLAKIKDIFEELYEERAYIPNMK